MLDITDRLNVRFYAFGNGDKDLDVIDAHIVSRDLTEAECKGDTHMDLESRLCTQDCHEDCDPLYGKETVEKSTISTIVCLRLEVNLLFSFKTNNWLSIIIKNRLK